MSVPPRRALLVIDVQNEYVSGGLPIEYPDVRVSLANIGRAMDAAAAHGIPIAVVQNSTPEGAPVFARGSPGWQLHDVVASRPRQHLFEKKLPSAFAGTDLAAWIEKNRFESLTVVGYMTQNCDDATMRDAVHRGLAVEFLSDASGALSYSNKAGSVSARQIHETYCVVLQSRFAAVMHTHEWIAALQSGTPPERDNVLASNQRARKAKEKPPVPA
jgi:nicotinamidase-related amidase